MQLSPAADGIVRTLHAHGYKAYLVGGCVRDLLLQRTPKDWDVATSALPDELIRLFPGAQLVGAHFGVILWHGVEIATFRSDGAYHDGRRPESVQFVTDAATDAQRRDFTVNGLFFDVQTDQVIDYVNGQSDLQRGWIRAIGEPAERFAEDHLRMLRAVRFAARFAFRIEERTAAAIRTSSAEITRIAPERIREELSTILTGAHPRRGLELLDELQLLPHILPEVKAMQGVPQPPEYHPEGDVWTHTLMMLDSLREPTITQAWGVLLHDVGKPPTMERTDRIRFNGHAELGARMSDAILHRLRYPTRVIEQVHGLVAQHMKFMAVKSMRESTRKRFLRQPLMPELLELHRLDCLSSNGNLDAYQFCLHQLETLPREVLAPPRLLTGTDLIGLGVPPGKAIGELLHRLEDAQLEGTVTTPDQAIAFVEAACAFRAPASEPSSTSEPRAAAHPNPSDRS